MNEPAIEYLSARQYVYLALQRLLGTDPTPELLGALDTPVLREALGILLSGWDGEDAGAIPPETEEALTRIETARKPDFDGAEGLKELQREYARCFVGPADLPAPPFESVHADRRRTLLTETTLKVRRTYQASGFEPALCRRVPDDHVALELDFMAELGSRALACALDGNDSAAYEYLKTSRKFLDDHLGTWASKFAFAMEEKADAPFYGKLAACAALCVAADQKRLAQMTHE